MYEASYHWETSLNPGGEIDVALLSKAQFDQKAPAFSVIICPSIIVISLTFFASGVIEMAEHAVNTARSLVHISNEDVAHIQKLGRLSGSCMQVHHALKRRPLANVAWVSKETGLTLPTVINALRKMEENELVKEIAGRRRNRVFSYFRYLNILVEGTLQ